MNELAKLHPVAQIALILGGVIVITVWLLCITDNVQYLRRKKK